MTGSLLYRNKSIDLVCQSVDWFLYDKDLRHERIKRRNLQEIKFAKPKSWKSFGTYTYKWPIGDVVKIPTNI